MNRAIKFLQGVWEDYLCWQGQDRKTLKRINLLITEAARDPLKGTGQLQPLVGNLSGYWSRRMDQIHRLVYRVDDHHVLVLQCPYHYGAKTLMKTGAGCGLVLKFWSVSFRPEAVIPSLPF